MGLGQSMRNSEDRHQCTPFWTNLTMDVSLPPLAFFNEVQSPALVFIPEQIAANIQKMIDLVGGDPNRLRPHCKTHKCSEIAKMLIEAGILQHKCATIVEALMLARAGAKDVLLSYPLIGPNLPIMAKLCHTYQGVKFSFLVDNHDALACANSAFQGMANRPSVWLDIDVGMGRTGIGPLTNHRAVGDLAKEVVDLGFVLKGIHLYDGHVNLPLMEGRMEMGNQIRLAGLNLRKELEEHLGLPLGIIVGGSPSFMAHSQMGWGNAVFSPGTLVLQDCGYGGKYSDMAGFRPAALLLTRVISRPGPGRITLDLGYKAISADPPLEKRAQFPEIPGAQIVMQSEEHLVLEAPGADEIPLGQALWAIPFHVCPTVALHDRATIWQGGQLIPSWEIDARTRFIQWDHHS